MPAPHTLLDHLAFGVPDVAAVAPLLVGRLGGVPRGAGPGAGFRFWQWEFAGGGALEILEPDGPLEGFLYRFLAERGPGPHHVTFKVPSIHAAMDRAKSHGHRVVGFDDRDPSWIEAFLHPKTAQGIVVQIVETHPGPGEDGPPHALAYPPSPEPALPPARLLGVRLCAHGAEKARRQWGDLLGGRCEADARGFCFRWPDSPLRVAVTVDPTRPEGPICLEWAAPRDLALGEGADPHLGLPLVQVDA